MRIAYFSPLNPIKSGVSDYSEELLPFLSKYMDIDLYVDNFEVTNHTIKHCFNVLPINKFESNHSRQPYDITIYHIGNNHIAHEIIYYHAIKHPGIVVLHDYAIHHMIASMTFGRGKKQEYINEMDYCHGKDGLDIAVEFVRGKISAPWENHSIDFPLNKRIIETAEGIIVHSYFSMGKIKQFNPFVPIKMIPMFTHVSKEPYSDYISARETLGINPNDIIIASFGFINNAKRIDKALEALSKLHKEDYKFKYYLVGEIQTPEYFNSLLDHLDIPNELVITTGHIQMDEFMLFMQAADICINLRYPFQGETSASLHRMLGLAKPVLVSNIGSFREYPDNTVLKIDIGPNEVQQLYKAIKFLLENIDQRTRLGQMALKFAYDYCQVEQIAYSYCNFTKKVIKSDYKYEALITSIASLLNEIDESSILVTECAKELSDFFQYHS